MTEIDEHFKFPSLLENLEVEQLGITNFEQRSLPLGLQKLFIVGCPLKRFSVDTFPDSFKELILDGTDLSSSEIRIIKFPPSLVSLLVNNTLLSSLDFVSSLPGSLEILNLTENSFGRLNETDEEADTTRSCQIKFPKNLQEFGIRCSELLFTLYSPENFVFPPSLVDLDLAGTNLVSIKGLELPPTLNSLSLRNNNLVSVDGLSLPLALTSLYLSFSKLVSVDGLSLPPTLTIFHLCDNNLELLSRRLPDSIQSLYLMRNKLSELENFHLLVSCTKFELFSNPLQKLQISNAYDPDLKLREFELSNVIIATLRDISPLPQCLTSLNISSTEINSLYGILLPVGLISLCVYLTKITSLENVEFPPYLERLDLLRNQISNLINVHLPDSLLGLNLDDNKFNSIDTIQFPPKLKELRFERNAIGAINELQLPESLKMLSLEDQTCETLQNNASTQRDISENIFLSKENGLSRLTGLTKLPPKLEYLNLGENSLSDQTIQSLESPASLKILLIERITFDDNAEWQREFKLAHPRMSIYW
ncbi:hypothetical protein BABINDRAFT_163765 [Babjeviella inositovora NRRL Y-12698]|uniref:L domain-like protein n=1 Tax=Babjeviella inositovora NRRL Y-12698 TaxID=984486 RepID=A0A1E3QI09_9ASCO|nr:uncharacterized protein BABINDRAFT_163765 [Babjeviella inositovora NRRL Y-12698]ODQ77270.1 hypothetical protein BABINDRAFT_163765 [Babjeviella inositovora NRRL Y-12698]